MKKLSFTKTALVTVAVFSVFSFVASQKVEAQVQSPAVEVPSWAPYIMIGKNDKNDNSTDNHIITFGRGLATDNCGLHYISGSYLKGFNFGRTWNTSIRNPSSHSGGRHAIFIDSNMNIGIDLWPHQISYKIDLLDLGSIRARSFVVSDRRYKRDIQPISNLDKLYQINPVQYKPSGEAFKEQLERLEEEGKYLSKEDLELAKKNLERLIAERNADTTTHFGFIAQELREIYPNLVNEDKQGYLAVNYTELIPVMLDAIKELNAKVDKLEGNDFEKTSDVVTVTSGAKLYQNNPNPFSENTEIKFYIPENSNSAMICIYDLTGSQIMKYDLRDKGYSSLTVRGSELKAGMYIYALLVDGKEIDTKRMILTDK
jgi:hypothetical protein